MKEQNRNYDVESRPIYLQLFFVWLETPRLDQTSLESHIKAMINKVTDSVNIVILSYLMESLHIPFQYT
jgi:hypothetical protein